MMGTSGNAIILCGQYRVMLDEQGQPCRVNLGPHTSRGVDVKRVIQFDTCNGHQQVTVRLEMADGSYFYGHTAITACGARESNPVGHFKATIEEIVPPHLREHLK